MFFGGVFLSELFCSVRVLTTVHHPVDERQDITTRDLRRSTLSEASREFGFKIIYENFSVATMETLRLGLLYLNKRNA